jgi:hypothetical protein
MKNVMKKIRRDEIKLSGEVKVKDEMKKRRREKKKN